MRLGIVTPVLTKLPRAHAAWEDDGGWDDVVAIARAADRLGYDHLTCSEHVAVPADAAVARGARYWDPLATFGALSAVTARIRFATYVLVLGYHHPLEIAKRYGTLDVISGGRLVLGVGVGSLQEEFELLGRPFANRGPRADDDLRALRSCLSVSTPMDYPGFVVDPHAVQEHVPIWVGGRTARSLRRAVTLGDGWAPFGLSLDEIAAMLTELDLADAFEVVLQPPTPLDAVGEPAAARSTLDAMCAAGCTIATLRVVHHSPAHYIEQLEAVMAL